MEIRTLPDYDTWFAGLRDRTAVLRITQRLARVQAGHFGDSKSVGGGVMELRIHHGPGIRLYFVRRGDALVLLLCGGDKSRQSADIQKAQELASRI